MVRTKLKDRILPNYTHGEEIFNMVSHIVGGAFGIIALILCIIVSAIHHNVLGIVSSAIYGVSLILLYTMSSVYHGISSKFAKAVMQILDHCTIYFLIAGTYTPILFCSIRKVSKAWSWILFGIVWGLAMLATVFTAIDLKKFSKFSMACYIIMGWCIILATKTLINSMELPGILYLFSGGIIYTIGAIFYCIGKKYKYMHSVFHIFVLIGSLLHFLCILFYVI